MIIKSDDLPEYVLRVWRLMEPPRSMPHRAASIVVKAAMFGTGCIRGTPRGRMVEFGASVTKNEDLLRRLADGTDNQSDSGKV